MQEFGQFGKLLIFAGAALVVFGLIISFGSKIPFIGKLPGDIFVKRGNFTFYFPIVTSIILSLLLTLVLNLFKR